MDGSKNLNRNKKRGTGNSPSDGVRVDPSEEALSPLMPVLDVLQVVPMELLQAGPPTTLEKEQLRVDPLLVAEHATKEGRTLAAAPSPGSSRLHPPLWLMRTCTRMCLCLGVCVCGGGGGW
jgi:hypothetical protein